MIDLTSRGDVPRDPDISADDGTPAGGDSAEDGGAGIDDEVIFHDRMAGVSFDERAVLKQKRLSQNIA
jgi:hypothetical protein